MTDDNGRKHALFLYLQEVQPSIRVLQRDWWVDTLTAMCEPIQQPEAGEAIQCNYIMVHKYEARKASEFPRGYGTKYYYKVAVYEKQRNSSNKLVPVPEKLSGVQWCQSHEITSQWGMSDEFWTPTEAALSMLFGLLGLTLR